MINLTDFRTLINPMWSELTFVSRWDNIVGVSQKMYWLEKDVSR